MQLLLNKMSIQGLCRSIERNKVMPIEQNCLIMRKQVLLPIEQECLIMRKQVLLIEREMFRIGILNQ